jgi:hypothetical protein
MRIKLIIMSFRLLAVSIVSQFSTLTGRITYLLLESTPTLFLTLLFSSTTGLILRDKKTIRVTCRCLSTTYSILIVLMVFLQFKTIFRTKLPTPIIGVLQATSLSRISSSSLPGLSRTAALAGIENNYFCVKINAYK